MEIKNLKISDIYNFIIKNPDSNLIFEVLENETINILGNDKKLGIIWLSRKINSATIKYEIFGYYFIQILNKKTTLTEIKQFLELLDIYTLKLSNGNYMEIDPILFSKDYSQDVLDFVEQYNVNERRKLIKLFKTI